MDSKIDALDLVKSAINHGKSFILQGGAGSGKTESLKRIIEYITKEYPNKRIACITYTNLAANELRVRVPNSKHHISTIHSFISSLIADYRKNIQQEFHTLFVLEELSDLADHASYKKLYEKYSNRLYRMREGETVPKVVGKKEYDKDTQSFIKDLNKKVLDFNTFIQEEISSKTIEKNSYKYNDTRFDSWKNQTFSHDSLLKLAFQFSNNYPIFNKLVADKYDFILIDEFQDTQQEVMSLFKNIADQYPKCILGLFGDSMQHIYDAGIGNIPNSDKRIIRNEQDIQDIEGGKFCEILKEDNYRCSFEVVNLINHLRNDRLEQSVVFKEKIIEVQENKDDRTGSVRIFPVIYDKKKPNAFSSQEDKDNFLEFIDIKIKELRSDDDKVLFLTNKAISIELDFVNLYNVFNQRFIEVKDEIESELQEIQLWDLLELCDAYDKRQYTFVIDRLKINGFKINNIGDKTSVSNLFEDLKYADYSAMQALDLVFGKGFLRKSESYENYIQKRKRFLQEVEQDTFFRLFERLYIDENITTYTRMNAYLEHADNIKSKAVFEERYTLPIVEKHFDELKNDYKKKVFYQEFFSDDLKFSELKNYYRYFIEDEESKFITMHKTKGSGIDSVFIVLEEYFWSQYNFERIYNPSKNKDTDEDKRKMQKNLNLLYVAASRAKKDLKILRVFDDESNKNMFIDFFKGLDRVTIEPC